MTGSPTKWQAKNHRSGLISNSATAWPLPWLPPSSAIWLIRSNISIGGNGNCALPGPNNSPRAQARRSSREKLDRRRAKAVAAVSGGLGVASDINSANAWRNPLRGFA